MQRAHSIAPSHSNSTATLSLASTRDEADGPKVQVSPGAALFTGNRRQHHRFNLVRSSKLYRRASNTYVPAKTINLSVGGALLEAAAARPFEPGEVVDIGVAFRPDRSGAVIGNDAMMQAIVVRVETIDEHRQAVALRYLNPHHHPAARAA